MYYVDRGELGAESCQRRERLAASTARLPKSVQIGLSVRLVLAGPGWSWLARGWQAGLVVDGRACRCDWRR